MDGILELYGMVNEGAYSYPTTDLEEALGHLPLTVRDWLKVAAPAFTPAAADLADATAKAHAAAEQVVHRRLEHNTAQPLRCKEVSKVPGIKRG